jgi:BASS family bile acid:Na+ symporter
LTLAELLPVALKASIFLIVLGIGLHATFREAAALFRRPGQLAQAILAMNLLMPAFAVGLWLAFDPHPAVSLALVALAVSPVPPILPRKALKAGGRETYTVGLLVAVSVLAVAMVPLAMALLSGLSPRPLEMGPGAVAAMVSVSVLLPLFLGMAWQRLAPATAERVAGPVGIAGGVLLAIALLPLLPGLGRGMLALAGHGTVLALAAFAAFGLAAGHALGGPRPENRIVLALATASRHPAIALAIAQANFPEQQLAGPAIVLYLLISAILSLPYLSWMRRRFGSPLHA